MQDPLSSQTYGKKYDKLTETIATSLKFLGSTSVTTLRRKCAKLSLNFDEMKEILLVLLKIGVRPCQDRNLLVTRLCEGLWRLKSQSEWPNSLFPPIESPGPLQNFLLSPCFSALAPRVSKSRALALAGALRQHKRIERHKALINSTRLAARRDTLGACSVVRGT